MHVAIVSLQRSVARRVTVLAARRGQHTINLDKRCARCCCVGLCGGVPGHCTRERRHGGGSESCQTNLKPKIPARLGGRGSMLDRAHDFASAFSAKSLARMGKRRTRFPVTAKIALASAGATGGTPGSPTPVGFALLGTIYTSIFGDSKMRIIW